jgi:DNA-binding NtrC family response regulator
MKERQELKVSDLTEFGMNLPRALVSLEAAFIERALEICNNQRTHAAQLLGMPRTRFLFKLKKYGFEQRIYRLRCSACKKDIHPE